MKNMLKFFGIVALLAIIVFGIAACDSGSGTSKNTDPKSIRITGIPGSGTIGVWIFAELPQGNAIPTVTAMAAGPIVAGTLLVDLTVPENETWITDIP